MFNDGHTITNVRNDGHETRNHFDVNGYPVSMSGLRQTFVCNAAGTAVVPTIDVACLPVTGSACHATVTVAPGADHKPLRTPARVLAGRIRDIVHAKGLSAEERLDIISSIVGE